MRLAAQALLHPADQLRAAVYRWLAPLAAPLYADRSRRVAVLGTLTVAASLALTFIAPMWMLALGPLLLGVPHLLADVRYLVVRPGLHRRWPLWLCLPPLLATSLGAGPEAGLLAMLPPLAISSASVARRVGLLLVWAALTACAWQDSILFQYLLLHAHNLVAVGLWWWWRPRDWRASVVLLAVLLGGAAILGGAAEPVLTLTGGWEAQWTGTTFDDLVRQNAPLADPALGGRLLLLFAFLQSVHYTMWLRLIPEDDRARPAPRPFVASWQALVDDFGRWPLAAVAAIAVGIAAWGLVDVQGARLGYLHLASFHGYLELAAAAYLASQPRRP